MSARARPVPDFWKRNGLTLVLLGCFSLCFLGQVLAGHRVFNEEMHEHQQPSVGLLAYLVSGHFFSTTFENWESEFLQMGAYVVLTVHLRQWGSAESRPFEDEPRETYPQSQHPWPARRGGVWRLLYGWSLSLAFLLLFAVSFCFHLWGSLTQHRLEQGLKGEAPVASVWAYLGEPQFWFESFQNWQSEFVAVIAIVVLTIFLRQKDSPQSKAVDAPHTKTGD